MKYIGIDLGTTNSAICSYDGESVRLYKSPDQNDVTPSAIFIDRRGNKYVGKRAYNNAAKNPDNAATKFKRLMGTSTPVKLAAVNLTMTPGGVLRRDPRSSASATCRRKSATAGKLEPSSPFLRPSIRCKRTQRWRPPKWRVWAMSRLMQEPVAAVMSVMRQRKGDGVFLVFDLGGGTLDIAIAESISGRVSLLAHGGIAMCGGTDFDRAILDNVVKPWLLRNFRPARRLQR